MTNETIPGQAGTPAKTERIPWYEWLAAAVLVLAATYLLYGMWSEYQASTPMGAVKNHVTVAELEQKYGIRLRLIGVTAAGGLVDFRYKIVNLAKARTLLEDHEKMPILAIEDSDMLLRMPESMMDHAELEEGQLYYAHYPNAAGIVRPGTRVSVLFGDLQVDPIAAK